MNIVELKKAPLSPMTLRDGQPGAENSKVTVEGLGSSNPVIKTGSNPLVATELDGVMAAM